MNLWDHVQTTLLAGGWLMLPLFILAWVLYTSALRLWLYLRYENRYMQHPPIPQLNQRLVTPAPNHLGLSPQPHLTAALIDRRVRFIATLTTIAPLAGLLGTVSGMLLTFSGLARGSNGQVLDWVASGISEALITTQAGLMIAIPAYVLLTMIRRERSKWEGLLVATGSACKQADSMIQ